MRYLRTVRVALAWLFFVAVTLLLLDFSGVLSRYVGWTAKLQFLPAVLALDVVALAATLVATLVLGRVYCSVVCPLGVMQDACSHVGGWIWKRRYRYVRNRAWLRWGVVVAVVALFAAGLGAAASLLAPYSAYGRMVSAFLQPLYVGVNNLFADWAAQHDSYLFRHVDRMAVTTAVMVVACATLLVVAAMSVRWGRAWCNNVCPVGTLLGWVGKHSLLWVSIDAEKCVKCRRCETGCKSQCIHIDTLRIDHSRCVACMDCVALCPTQAIAYGRRAPRQENAHPGNAVDDGRRRFLATAALTVGVAAAQARRKRLRGALALMEDRREPPRRLPLKPAGSQGLQRFSRHCTACQLCVSHCPNGVLRPSTRLEALMQPEMGFEKGYCRPECVACGHACPTGAIRPVSPAEKSAIQVGVAVYVPANCVVNTDGVSCGHCASHCPTGAIILVPKDASDPSSRLVPSVNESLCIGCGACEHLCPARPSGAIYVEGKERHTER